MGLIQKKRRAISVLRKHRGVLVALSGGVDSAALLVLAREALGSQHVLAVTGRSASVTGGEIEDAARVARALGVRHEIVDTRELESPDYRQNRGDRCFHCRSELFSILSRAASERGIAAIAYGAIVDDLGDDRPGMDAAREFGILAPLLDAGMSKEDARQIADDAGLHVYDKPASPCLASRIPIGTEVTEDRLQEVGRAEAALREFGFRLFRVRHHGEIARLELGDTELQSLESPALRAKVVEQVRAAGFRFVVVDLVPFRSGSLGAGRQAARLYSIEPSRLNGQ
jgi:uncharacterized protein